MKMARALSGLFMGLCLGGCAELKAPAPTAPLLHDEFFVAPREPVDKTRVFALTEPMQRYADAQFGSLSPLRDIRRVLVESLQRQGFLHLNYDAGNTRNAAEAFETRAGNCLSLVIMTAAFARHLGIPVAFQSVQVDENYTRSGDLTLAAGHVNLVLGKHLARAMTMSSLPDDLTVDFLPFEDLRRRRTTPLDEATIVAMYLNNRAAENLADGRLDQAYAWAREAVLQAPGFRAAVNTLAVIYLRSGHPAQAEVALRQVLADDPDGAPALSNLVVLLRRAGRGAEADAAQQQLTRVQPRPPFFDFDRGRRAMDAGDYAQAGQDFDRELRRQPYQSEVHFWAALAAWRLGDRSAATRHLALAVENSTTTGSRELYAAKLARLRETPVQ